MEKARFKPIGPVPERFKILRILSDFSKEGTVYELLDQLTHESVVMKVFSPHKSKTSIKRELDFQEKFHPYSPRVLHKGPNYFIMEMGIPVRTILEKNPGNIDFLRFLFVNFGFLIEFQVQKKLLHNDTKLDNLVLSKNKLIFIDFGFSKNAKNVIEVYKTVSFSLNKLYKELSKFYPKPNLEMFICLENWVSKKAGVPPLLKLTSTNLPIKKKVKK
jgi:serine/threonine protein kinase